MKFLKLFLAPNFITSFLSIFLLMEFIFVQSICYASTKNVSGVIYGESQEGKDIPLPFSSVAILHTNQGCVSDENGVFELNGFQPGRYKLRISHIGYDTKEIGIEVTNHNISDLTVKLRRNLLELNQIVVTATRTERIYQESPVPTMILSNREIKESGSSDVAGLLSDRLGLDLRFGRSGGLSAEIQGADPKYALILIDGEPVIGRFDNRVELGALSASKIDRIEIVKGPGSAMYGSEAMSGVINIITKDAVEPVELGGELKTGSQDLRTGNAQLGLRKPYWKIFLTGSFYQQGQAPQRDYITLSGVDSYETGLKWTRLLNGGSDSKFDVGLNFSSHSETSKDVAVRYETLLERWDVRPTLKIRYRPWADVKFKSRVAEYRREYNVYVRRTGFHLEEQSNATTERIYSTGLEYWRQFTDSYEASFGLAFQTSQFQANRISWGKQIESSQWSIFAQSERKFNAVWLLSFGARYDRNDNFGDAFAPKVAVMWRPTDEWKVRGSIGKGYRSPSWVELFLTFPHPAVGYTAFGNSSLKQETSIGYNLGFEYLYHNRLLCTVNGFLNEFRNKIDDYAVSPNVLSYKNVGNSFSGGGEITFKWYVSRQLHFSSGYQWLKVYDRDEKIELPHNRHSANVRLESKFKDDGVVLSLRSRIWQRFERRYDLRIGDYTQELNKVSPKPLMDATLTFKGTLIQPTSNWRDLSLSVGGTNLLDYTNTIYGPFTGRRWFVTLGWKYNPMESQPQ